MANEISLKCAMMSTWIIVSFSLIFSKVLSSNCEQWNNCATCALHDDCSWCDNNCIDIMDECITEHSTIDTPGCDQYNPITDITFDTNEILTYRMDIELCQISPNINISLNETECEQQTSIVSFCVESADNKHLNYHLFGHIESIMIEDIDILNGMSSPPFCDIFIQQSAVTNITCGNWTNNVPTNESETDVDPNKLQTDTLLSILHDILPRLDNILFKSNINELNFSETQPNGMVYIHRDAVDDLSKNHIELTSHYHLNDFEQWDNDIKPYEMIVNQSRIINHDNKHITKSHKYEMIELSVENDNNYLEEIDIEIRLIQQSCCVNNDIFIDWIYMIYNNKNGYFSHHFTLKQWRKGQYKEQQNMKPSFQIDSNETDIDPSPRRRLNTADYVEIFTKEKKLIDFDFLGFSIEVELFVDVGLGLPWKSKNNYDSWDGANGCSSFGDFIAKQSSYYDDITACCNIHDADYSVNCDVTKVSADNALIECIDGYDPITAQLFDSAFNDISISSLYYYRAKSKYCYLDPSDITKLVDISTGIAVKINGKSIFDVYSIGGTEEKPQKHIAQKNIKVFGGCIWIIFANFCLDLYGSLQFTMDGSLIIKNDELIFEMNPKLALGIVIDANVNVFAIKGGVTVRGDVIQATVPHIYVNIPLSGHINPYIAVNVILETAVVTLSVYWQHWSIKCKCWFCLCPRFSWSGKKTIWYKRYELGSKSTLKLLSWQS